MQRIISAGIIIFRRTSQGVKFLILYHGRNYWNFPKGKVEHQEKSDQAALREVQEETGLKPSELRPVTGFQTSERFSYQRGKDQVFKTVVLYLAETRQPNITVSHEHEGYGWFTYAEARRILSKYKDSLRILDQAHDFLHRRGPTQIKTRIHADERKDLHAKGAGDSAAHPARSHAHVRPGGAHGGQAAGVPGGGHHS